MAVSISDTSAEARAVQLQVFVRMTPDQRFRAATSMGMQVKEAALAGIRQRNPSFTDEQVIREWFMLLHGPELTESILGSRHCE